MNSKALFFVSIFLIANFSFCYAQSNENKLSVKFPELQSRLDSVYDSDQKYRIASDWKMVMKMDSVNQIEVLNILEKYGWLGPEEVGKKGNVALFLVIQHAELAIQEKYLPMMQQAVKNKKARPPDLALLEDRVLMGQNKKQIYGSQISKDKNGKWIVHPIEDPQNVDKRRAEIGLMPIAEYVAKMGLTWNLEEHIKEQKEGKN
jgi:hypothetical protein